MLGVSGIEMLEKCGSVDGRKDEIGWNLVNGLRREQVSRGAPNDQIGKETVNGRRETLRAVTTAEAILPRDGM